MKETTLYEPIVKGANMGGWLLYRVRDSQDGRQPFDISGIAPGGRGAGVEVKVLRPHPAEIVTLDQLKLRANQEGWLIGYSSQGAHALVLCYREDLDDIQVVRIVTRYAGMHQLNFPEVVGSLARSQTSDLFVGWSALWNRLRQP